MGSHRGLPRSHGPRPGLITTAAVVTILLVGGGVTAWSVLPLRAHHHAAAGHPESRIAARAPAYGADRIAPSRAQLATRDHLLRSTELARKRYVRAERRRLRPTPFVISSFNLLGNSHTTHKGNKGRRGYPSGSTRMVRAVAMLRQHSVSVAGLQEFQIPQYRTFMRIASSEYAVYPGAAGGNMGVQNSIVWRRSEWTLVEAHTLGVRYFHGSVVQMPYIELKNTTTGQHAWFANYHNPADVRGRAGHWRAIDARMEANLFKQLLTTKAPVFVTGDMNDRATYFCQVSAIVPELHGANGSVRAGGSCRVPRHAGIDWIIGSKIVEFSGFTTQRDRHTSDHAIVVAKATIRPALGEPGAVR